MAIPSDFAQECMYRQPWWFVHDVLELDEAANRVVAVMDTTQLGDQVAMQHLWPGHEPHVPAAVMVQATGVLGNLHAAYVLGLRPTQGWVGYGTKVENARFPAMGRIGPPVTMTLEARRVRKVRGRYFIDYVFTYEQDGEQIYCSEQSAVWFQSDHRGPCPDAG